MKRRWGLIASLTGMLLGAPLSGQEGPHYPESEAWKEDEKCFTRVTLADAQPMDLNGDEDIDWGYVLFRIEYDFTREHNTQPFFPAHGHNPHEEQYVIGRVREPTLIESVAGAGDAITVLTGMREKLDAAEQGVGERTYDLKCGHLLKSLKENGYGPFIGRLVPTTLVSATFKDEHEHPYLSILFPSFAEDLNKQRDKIENE